MTRVSMVFAYLVAFASIGFASPPDSSFYLVRTNGDTIWGDAELLPDGLVAIEGVSYRPELVRSFRTVEGYFRLIQSPFPKKYTAFVRRTEDGPILDFYEYRKFISRHEESRPDPENPGQRRMVSVSTWSRSASYYYSKDDGDLKEHDFEIIGKDLADDPESMKYYRSASRSRWATLFYWPGSAMLIYGWIHANLKDKSSFTDPYVLAAAPMLALGWYGNFSFNKNWDMAEKVYGRGRNAESRSNP